MSVSLSLSIPCSICLLIRCLANALPESTTALVNHRIAVEESVQDVKTHYRRIIDPWAQNLGLKFQEIEVYEEKFIKKGMVWKSSDAKLTLTTLSELEPSPISSPLDPRFTWLAGALQSVFGEDVIVAPVLEGGELSSIHGKDGGY
jgi:Gly-Xaa carboxypeptidase